MKKILFVVAMLVSSLVLNAQDGLKGTWFAGGAVSFGSTKTHDNNKNEMKYDTYSVMPLVGTFISPTVAVGGALGYTHTKFDHLKGNTYTVMPLVRKYWNITGPLYFYGQAALPVSFGNSKYKDIDDTKTDNFGVHIELSPGFDVIVNDWLTFEVSFVLATAGYKNEHYTHGPTNTSWTINGNTINGKEFGDLTVGMKFLF